MSNIQRICEVAGKYGCLAFCYLFVIGIDTLELIKNYQKLVDMNILREDFFVLDGDRLISFFGSKKRVQRLLPTGITAGRLFIQAWFNENTGHTHYVAMKDSEIVFDPLGDSITCRDGNPTSDIREVV